MEGNLEKKLFEQKENGWKTVEKKQYSILQKII